MAQVTLAKALKLKNRQVQKVKGLQERIQASNSRLVGSEADFDARALYGELRTETANLWRLKQAINAANVPVHAAIYEMAETKGLIAFLKTLNTKRGKVESFGEEAFVYEAAITGADSQAEVEALEARIDVLQDALDLHNATTLVDVEE
ncbi:hypothetical protein EON81_03795 [bacterium]|nr:MAG: hypothetical protein EON81_03795 [bacterium]